MINNKSNLPKQELPKERLLQFGASHLTNQELLSIILGSGSDTTSKLLNVLESIQNLREVTIEELTSIKGIGEAKATMLLSVIELGKRMYQFRPQENYIIRSPEDGADYVMEEMRHLQQEHFVALFLDTKNKVMHKQTIFIGSLNASVVHPREVYREAVKRSAASLVVAHNHPSGDPTPSQEDIHVTRRLVESGKMIGIEILDHIIIGDRKFTSLKEKGYI